MVFFKFLGHSVVFELMFDFKIYGGPLAVEFCFPKFKNTELDCLSL